MFKYRRISLNLKGNFTLTAIWGSCFTSPTVSSQNQPLGSQECQRLYIRNQTRQWTILELRPIIDSISEYIEIYTAPENGWYIVYAMQNCSFIGFTMSFFVDCKPLYKTLGKLHNYIPLEPLYRVEAIPRNCTYAGWFKEMGGLSNKIQPGLSC